MLDINKMILDKKYKERQDRIFIMMKKGEKEDLQKVIQTLEINKYTRFFYNAMFFYLLEIKNTLIDYAAVCDKTKIKELEKAQNKIQVINEFLEKYYKEFLD